MNCPECGAKPGKGGVVNLHKKGCPLKTKKAQDIPEAILPQDGFTMPLSHFEAMRNQEAIREPQDTPEVGQWFVVKFWTPMGLSNGRKSYRIHLAVAPVKSVRPHGRDSIVEFDMDQAREFSNGFDAELFSPAADVVKAMRSLIADIERATA